MASGWQTFGDHRSEEGLRVLNTGARDVLDVAGGERQQAELPELISAEAPL